jgi:hypothetical protein
MLDVSVGARLQTVAQPAEQLCSVEGLIVEACARPADVQCHHSTAHGDLWALPCKVHSKRGSLTNGLLLQLVAAKLRMLRAGLLCTQTAAAGL